MRLEYVPLLSVQRELYRLPLGEDVSGALSMGVGVMAVGGDAADPAFAAAVAHGAEVVYQTLNPPYHQWTTLFPALQKAVLGAAEATGARLVSETFSARMVRGAGLPDVAG